MKNSYFPRTNDKKMNSFNISVHQFNENAEEYCKKFIDISSYQKFLKIFCTLIHRKQADILELACGPGNITRYIKQHIPEAKIIAVDLAPNMIKIAKSIVKDVDFRLMDVRNIESFNCQFDAIMCSFCLPFLSQADAFKLIANCAKLLKTEGIIYLSTMESGENRAGFETTSFSGKDKIYFNYFSQSFLVNAFLANGFNIRHLIRQNYSELDGKITIDMVFICQKL